MEVSDVQQSRKLPGVSAPARCAGCHHTCQRQPGRRSSKRGAAPPLSPSDLPLVRGRRRKAACLSLGVRKPGRTLFIRRSAAATCVSQNCLRTVLSATVAGAASSNDLTPDAVVHARSNGSIVLHARHLTMRSSGFSRPPPSNREWLAITLLEWIVPSPVALLGDASVGLGQRAGDS